MPTPSRTIAVAMSGGVDSSVAAALLVEQGFNVFGVILRLWSAGPEASNRCCSPEDVSLARRVASQLEIPFYALDATAKFKNKVVDPFINGYAKGRTPNPCLRCNRFIRWGFLLESVLSMGASRLATGHYARIRLVQGRSQLLRALDSSKDQSYVLSILSQDHLSRTVFPLGDFTKDQVRKYAAELNLPIADRAESQDLCFVGDQDYRDFLKDQGIELSPPGPIQNEEGETLGQHSGLANYTIGQRKGIGVAKSFPLYVIHKDTQDNVLVVGPKERLGRTSFMIEDANWISGSPPSSDRMVHVRVRYKAEEVRASLRCLNDTRTEVQLLDSLPDVTPGQYAVFYEGEVCLGGGLILP